MLPSTPSELCYQEGRVSFSGGALFDANPYGDVDADTSGLAAEWSRGWLDAREASIIVPGAGDSAPVGPATDAPAPSADPAPAPDPTPATPVDDAGSGSPATDPTEAVASVESTPPSTPVDDAAAAGSPAPAPTTDPTEAVASVESTPSSTPAIDADPLPAPVPAIEDDEFPEWVIVTTFPGAGLPPFLAGRLVVRYIDGIVLELPAVESIDGRAFAAQLVELPRLRVSALWGIDRPTARALRLSTEHPNTTLWGVPRAAVPELSARLKPAA